MATRSRIGFQLDDYSIHSVYVHFDGSPSHNGKILLEDYTEAAKVRELVSHGAISILKVGRDWQGNPREEQPLRYCERGEPVEIKVSMLEEFLNNEAGEEYAYLFTLNGEWHCFDLGRSDGIAQIEMQPKKKPGMYLVTSIEFDFSSDEDAELQGLLIGDKIYKEVIGSVWEADDEEDLAEEITAAYGFCVKSIDYQRCLA